MNTSILLNLFNVSVMEFVASAETALELINDIMRNYTIRSIHRESAGRDMVSVKVEVIGMIVK